MRKLKTYEEFNWHDIAPFGYYAVGTLLTRLGLKLYTDKKKRDRFKDMLTKDSGIYTNSRWEIKEDGDIITLKRDRLHRVIHGDDRVEGPDFIINKKDRTFEYRSSYPLKTKISKEQLSSLLDGISFAKEVTESIDDCFYDLKDEGYDVFIRSVDFAKKSFVINIRVNEHSRYTRMNLTNMSNILNETLHRITNQYDVVVDRLFKLDRIYAGDTSITSYDNGIVKLSTSRFLKTGDIYDLTKDFQANRYKYKYSFVHRGFHQEDGFDIHSLTIPFIKK